MKPARRNAFDAPLLYALGNLSACTSLCGPCVLVRANRMTVEPRSLPRQKMQQPTIARLSIPSHSLFFGAVGSRPGSRPRARVRLFPPPEDRKALPSDDGIVNAERASKGRANAASESQDREAIPGTRAPVASRKPVTLAVFPSPHRLR